MSDRRDPIVGRTDVVDVDGTVRFLNEFELRDGIAALAWLAGWDVQTEAPVSSTGGRADILLTGANGNLIVIEVKTRLETLRHFRLGFQQAEGYRLHFEHKAPGKVLTLLIANTINYDIGAPVGRLYPEVLMESASQLICDIRSVPDFAAWGWADGLRHKATKRRKNAEHVANLARAACGQLVVAYLADIDVALPPASTTLWAAVHG